MFARRASSTEPQCFGRCPTTRSSGLHGDSRLGSKLQAAKNPAPPTHFPKYTTRTESEFWRYSSQLGGAPSGLTVAGALEAIDATHIPDHPSVDSTGIQGHYDIELTAQAEVPENRPAASSTTGV
jgi:hypothetical protein